MAGEADELEAEAGVEAEAELEVDIEAICEFAVESEPRRRGNSTMTGENIREELWIRRQAPPPP